MITRILILSFAILWLNVPTQAWADDLKPAISVAAATPTQVKRNRWRIFRTRVKPVAEFTLSVVTCIFSITGAVRR